MAILMSIISEKSRCELKIKNYPNVSHSLFNADGSSYLSLSKQGMIRRQQLADASQVSLAGQQLLPAATEVLISA